MAFVPVMKLAFRPDDVHTVAMSDEVVLERPKETQPDPVAAVRETMRSAFARVDEKDPTATQLIPLIPEMVRVGIWNLCPAALLNWITGTVRVVPLPVTVVYRGPLPAVMPAWAVAWFREEPNVFQMLR